MKRPKSGRMMSLKYEPQVEPAPQIQSAATMQVLRKYFDPTRCLDYLRTIFEEDRKSTFTAYGRTAVFLKEKMESLGLTDVELEPLPADGRTRFGDWSMPLAWDVTDGTLDLLGEGMRVTQTLASYSKNPDSLIMQSAPTAPEGCVAELVLDDEKTSAAWRGKVVFTERHAQKIKAEAARAGALGIVSCHHPFPEEDRDSTYWYNTWSDRPSGWFASADDARLFGFSLSPNAGADLLRRLKQGERMRVRCRVDSRLYEGTMPFVSGRLPGTGPRAEEELLVCAHLYEHGAHDNASGAATVLELASAWMKALDAGELPRPERSIRFLLMPECYGTLAYAALRRERISRTVAGVNLDGVGGGTPLRIIPEPPCTDAGLADGLYSLACQAWGEAHVKKCSFELADNILADPAIGVPMVWPHAPCARQTWHTSLDDLKVVDLEAIERMVQVVGAFLMDVSRRDVALKKSAQSAQSTLPATGADQDARGGDRVPERQGIGPLSLDPVPQDQWLDGIDQSPRWYGWYTRALWWADGQRTLSEIAALLNPGQGTSQLDQVANYFEFLETWGYIKWQPRKSMP